MLLMQIAQRRIRNPFLLHLPDTFLRGSLTRAGPGLYLHKMDPLLRAGDQINLQVPRTPVPVQDPMPCGKQISAGGILSFTPPTLITDFMT